MKRASVKPIAIFDEPGPREWKAREHVRRQHQRSLHLARSLLEDARRERLGKIEAVLHESRRLLQKDQLPVLWNDAGVGMEFEFDVEKELLNLEDAQVVSSPGDLNLDLDLDVDLDPGKKILQAALMLLRDCRASSRPGEKHTNRSNYQFLKDRFLKEDSEAEAEVTDSLEGEVGRGDTKIGDAGKLDVDNNDPDDGLVVIENGLERISLAAPSAGPNEQTLDEALVGQEEDDVDVEDIATVVVEPSHDFTESIRQTALTANENYLLSDIIKTLTTASPTPTQMTFIEYQQELRNLQDRAGEVARTYERSHAKPTAQDIEEARELLQVMGVPIVQAPSPYEAEGLAAAMVLGGMADYAGTEDSDVLVYGALLLRNVGTGTQPLQSIDGEEFRCALGLSEGQYRDFLILNGTDACERIHGVGFKRALKLIKEYGNIETILEKAQSKKISLRALTQEGYLGRVAAARRVFEDLPMLPTELEVRQQDVEVGVVDGFLRDRHGIVMLTDEDTVGFGDTVETGFGEEIGFGHLAVKRKRDDEPSMPELPEDSPDWMVGAGPPR
jgi:flap endonuclease-1